MAMMYGKSPSNWEPPSTMSAWHITITKTTHDEKCKKALMQDLYKQLSPTRAAVDDATAAG